MSHVTVLLHELIDGLDIQAGDVILDCTLNGGGHSEEILKRWGNNITLVGIDADQNAISRAKAALDVYGGHTFFLNGNFRDMERLLAGVGIRSVDRVLFDLGLSSNQYDESHRGFTFQKDEPLLMTLNAEPGQDDITAARIVNQTGEAELADLIFKFGEERHSRHIAKAIVAARKKKRIDTTFELVKAIESSVPGGYRHQKIHPATKTFQALRIATNDELQSFKDAVATAFTMLSTGGRIGVISFHSLEDRIAKQYFNELSKDGKAIRINKKVITASPEELSENPRSRSAKLRIIKKT
jgi:16S rRNA (cytosine1402-N4)-methyltransferase